MATAVFAANQDFAPLTSQVADSAPAAALAQEAADDQFIATFFCRALYDYQSADDSSLSFHRGDIIEVLNRLETGWWDGLLGEERGWFPSNYVVVISDEEADVALAASELQQAQQSALIHPTNGDLANGTSTLPGMTTSSNLHPVSQTGQGNWSDGDGFGGGRAGMDELAAASMDSATQSNDFWVPQVTSDGQIYYVNTQTGQHSRDLPTEAEDEFSDAEFNVVPQQRSRSTSTAGVVYGRVQGAQPSVRASTAGFGLPKRSGTPDPWVRRLADDGLTYFYLNKLDGTVRWTAPDGLDARRTNGYAQAEPARSAAPTRTRSDSAASFVPRSRSGSVSASNGVYSDDSDVDPVDQTLARSANRQTGSRPMSRHPSSQAASLGNPSATPPTNFTSAEKIAISLQNSLNPSPPETLSDLSSIARQAVASVLNFIQAHGLAGPPEEHRALETRILDAVVAIRNLLSVSSPPHGHLPSTLYPRDSLVPGSSAATQAMHAQLKPAQRRVTATLSKLVLAALAAQYDATSFPSDAPARMEADATELDRALVTFVLDVQRANTTIGPSERTLGRRRLRATFFPTNIGLGLFGAGAAGMWKGFGWNSLLDDQRPERTLPDGVLTDLRRASGGFDEKLSTLIVTLRAASNDVARVQSCVRAVTAWLQSLLGVISAINLAKTVDIDGMGSEGRPANETYMQSVHKARSLVRVGEAAVQALFDDGASLLVAAQCYSVPSPAPDSPENEALQSFAVNLKTTVTLVADTFESLLLIGQEQADKGQNDYRGSIDWRASRLDPSISQTLEAIANFEDDMGDEPDDVVSMDPPFSKPRAKPFNQTDRQLNGVSNGRLGGEYEPDDFSADTPTAARGDGFQDPSAKSPANDSSLAPPPPGFDDTASLFPDDESSTLAPSVSTVKSPSRAEKLIRILGDLPPPHIVDQLNAETKPWYLRPNYSQTDIIIDPDGKVRGGTVPALVERLTAHEHSDTSFQKTFLMTFRSFTDLDTLFDLLVQRFWIKPPEGLTPSEMDEWKKLKQHIIRTRVLNTFKAMVQDDDVLDKGDLYLLGKMKDMISNEEVANLAAAKQLSVLIERTLHGDNARAKTTISLDPQPTSILPRFTKKIKLLDFDPLETARQLTIIECQLFLKIRASECLTRSRDQKVGSDNIAAAIETTNKIAHWVADTVLEKEDSRKRALVVKHFVSVADRCRELRNFSSMIAIVSGLNSPPIRRLKRTWEQISQKFLSMLGTCEMTIDSGKNFTYYRQLLQRITPPCVPFIGVYLTTLTFIQDGAPNNISGNLVNFRKRTKASEVILEIQKWQSKPFNFAKVDAIYEYIQEQLNKFNNIPDISDIFWDLSLQREPREREDEKMARLLQETGFL